MKPSKVIVLIGFLFVTAPISLYLQYKVLQLVGATELMMFLFWIYLPVTILLAIISKVSDGE